MGQLALQIADDLLYRPSRRSRAKLLSPGRLRPWTSQAFPTASTIAAHTKRIRTRNLLPRGSDWLLDPEVAKSIKEPTAVLLADIWERLVYRLKRDPRCEVQQLFES